MGSTDEVASAKDLSQTVSLQWLQKHRHEMPVAICLFANCSESESEWKQEEPAVLNLLDVIRYNCRGKNIRLLVAFVSSSSEIVMEERITAFRRRTDLEKSNVFHFGKHDDDTTRLQKFLLEHALNQCKDEGRRARKEKKEAEGRPRGPNLSARQNFKIAFFAECRKDFKAALKHYTAAYTTAKENVRVEESKWLAMRTFSFILSYKISQLLFESNAQSEAIDRFRRHISFFKHVKGPTSAIRDYISVLVCEYEVFGDFLLQFKVGHAVDNPSTSAGLYYSEAALWASRLQRHLPPSLQEEKEKEEEGEKERSHVSDGTHRNKAREDALNLVEVLRQRVGQDSETYLPDLAASLNNAAVLCANDDNSHTNANANANDDSENDSANANTGPEPKTLAITLVEEAVALYEKLAGKNGERFTSLLQLCQQNAALLAEERDSGTEPLSLASIAVDAPLVMVSFAVAPENTITLLHKAYRFFHDPPLEKRYNRCILTLGFDIAMESYRLGRFEYCLKFLSLLRDQYRREGWSLLWKKVDSMALEVCSHPKCPDTHDTRAVYAVAASDLMCTTSGLSEREKTSLYQSLLQKDPQDAVTLILPQDSDAPLCLHVSWQAQRVDLGQPVALFISLVSQLPEEVSVSRL